jgi:hypothetical protein
MAGKIGAEALKPNPAMKLFAPLIGEWRTTGSHPYFPGVELHGRAKFEWIEGGAFLMLRSEVDHPGFPDGIEVFGSDDEAGTYYMLHFDERGVSRKFDVSVTKDQFKWRRDDPRFSQRLTLNITKGKLISSGEMSRDGGEWGKDLSMTYERL